MNVSSQSKLIEGVTEQNRSHIIPRDTCAPYCRYHQYKQYTNVITEFTVHPIPTCIRKNPISRGLRAFKIRVVITVFTVCAIAYGEVLILNDNSTYLCLFLLGLVIRVTTSTVIGSGREQWICQVFFLFTLKTSPGPKQRRVPSFFFAIPTPRFFFLFSQNNFSVYFVNIQCLWQRARHG